MGVYRGNTFSNNRKTKTHTTSAESTFIKNMGGQVCGEWGEDCERTFHFTFLFHFQIRHGKENRERREEKSRTMNHHIITIILHIYKRLNLYPVARKKCQMCLCCVSVLEETAFRKETGLNMMHFTEKTKYWINIHKCMLSPRQINDKFHKST